MLLRALAQLFSDDLAVDLGTETALPITVGADPLTCVVRGAGQLLDTLACSGG
jgi:hypothetical protein